MLINAKHDANTYHLNGESITQQQLTQYLNDRFGTTLSYRRMTIEAFKRDRINELGEFMGTVIAGIYEQIAISAMNNQSDFAKIVGREHMSWTEYFNKQ